MNKILLSIASGIADFFEAAPAGSGAAPECSDYLEYLRNTEPSPEELCAHSEHIMKKMPLVSVIILADSATTEELTASVNSVSTQAYRNIEIVAVLSTQKMLSRLPRADNLRSCVVSDGVCEMTDAAIKLAHGEYLIFLHTGDILRPDLFYRAIQEVNAAEQKPDIIYADEDILKNSKRTAPSFKPDYSPDTLLSYNYIGRAVLISRELMIKCGSPRSVLEEDFYSFLLRATDAAEFVMHIPYVGYTCAAPPPLPEPMRMRALIDSHLSHKGLKTSTSSGQYEGSFRVRYAIPKKSDINVIVVAHGDTDSLRKCLEQIEETTTYDDYRLTVASMGIEDALMPRYLSALKNAQAATVHRFAPTTTRAQALNACVYSDHARAFVFLDCHVMPLSPDWLEAMAQIAFRDSIGAVGAKLVSHDNRIVSAGYVVGLNGWWQSPYFGEEDGFGDRERNRFLNNTRDVSAVSADCMMIRSDTFTALGGFDDSFRSVGEDVELCIRLASKRLGIVYTPFARMLHTDPQSVVVPSDETVRCYDTCRDLLLYGDPLYNPAYDYGSLIPLPAAKPYPAIKLNPMFEKQSH